MQKANINTNNNIINNKTATPKNKSSGVSYLNIIALGDNINNTMQLLINTITDYNCNIINSRLVELGTDLAFSAVINGKWNNIVKLEKALNAFTNNKKFALSLYTKRNRSLTTNYDATYIHYTVHTTTINKPEIFNKLLQFFYSENIKIKEANVSPHNYCTDLISIEIKLKIPAEVHIITLRDKFLTYCDQLNIDASLEPIN